MKKLNLILLATFISLHVFAATSDYQCTPTKMSATDSGAMLVSVSSSGQIKAVGNYSVNPYGDAMSNSFNCVGKHRAGETRAAYFKAWVIYDFTGIDKSCGEWSIRIKKDANGNPDPKVMALVNYNGDNHDYSGYQSVYFNCTPALH